MGLETSCPWWALQVWEALAEIRSHACAYSWLTCSFSIAGRVCGGKTRGTKFELHPLPSVHLWVSSSPSSFHIHSKYSSVPSVDHLSQWSSSGTRPFSLICFSLCSSLYLSSACVCESLWFFGQCLSSSLFLLLSSLPPFLFSSSFVCISPPLSIFYSLISHCISLFLSLFSFTHFFIVFCFYLCLFLFFLSLHLCLPSCLFSNSLYRFCVCVCVQSGRLQRLLEFLLFTQVWRRTLKPPHLLHRFHKIFLCWLFGYANTFWSHQKEELDLIGFVCWTSRGQMFLSGCKETCPSFKYYILWK